MPRTEYTSGLTNFNPDNSIRRFGSASKTQLKKNINILVWNIYKGRKVNWQNDFDHLMRGQDLAILQEAVYNCEHDSIFNNDDNFEWVMARSFRNQKNGLETGVKTGAVAKPVETTSLFSNYFEPFSRTPKLALSTHYKIEGQKELLMVLNVHAINFVSIAKYTNQLNQLECEISTHTGPVILAGDFNTWSTNRFARFEKCAIRSGLDEARMKRVKKLKHMNKHLDHVYYRGLHLSGIESIASIDSSDHHPIIVKFVQQTPD